MESEFDGDRCFGILANMDFIMVCTYEAEGANPELLLYKKDSVLAKMLHVLLLLISFESDSNHHIKAGYPPVIYPVTLLLIDFHSHLQ